MDPELARQLPTILVGLGAGLALSLVMLWYGVKRLLWLRSQTLDLSDERERLMLHLQYRTGAQKHQALAASGDGAERIEHLRRARDLWRQANQTRNPADEETFESIKRTIALIEEQLTELGVDPEEE